MANYRGHLGGGVITFVLATLLLAKMNVNLRFDLLSFSLWFVSCLLGSLFPDIDIWSKGQKILYLVLLVSMSWAIAGHQWNLVVGLSVIAFFPLFVRHRGITHSIGFIIIAPLLVPLTVSLYTHRLTKLSYMCYVFFVLGAVSHLLLDFGPKRLLQRFLGYRSN